MNSQRKGKKTQSAAPFLAGTRDLKKRILETEDLLQRLVCRKVVRGCGERGQEPMKHSDVGEHCIRWKCDGAAHVFLESD